MKRFLKIFNGLTGDLGMDLPNFPLENCRQSSLKDRSATVM